MIDQINYHIAGGLSPEQLEKIHGTARGIVFSDETPCLDILKDIEHEDNFGDPRIDDQEFQE